MANKKKAGARKTSSARSTKRSARRAVATPAAAPVSVTPGTPEADKAGDPAQRAKAPTRPGFQRRTMRHNVSYQGNSYGPGEHIEVPDGLAATIDASMTNPDASKELARAGGKGAENDQEAQGKKIADAADPDKRRKARLAHRQNNPAFVAIAEPSRSEGARRRSASRGK